jgi:superfamily I DNA and RNA helicase
LRRFTNAYDLLGRQIMTDGQLTFDSITRFKGQESPAVIIVDIDPDPADLEQAERLLLSGMTRATLRLELLVQRDNPMNDRLLRT